MLNGFDAYGAYISQKNDGTELAEPTPAWQHSLLGVASSTRLHAIDRSSGDPRYACFRAAFDRAADDRERARALRVWVVTRSTHLLDLLQPGLQDRDFLGDALFQTTKKRRKKDGTHEECAVALKTPMPAESRDVGLNCVSTETVLRHLNKVYELKGKRFGDLDALAAEIMDVDNAGHFLAQHFCWNLTAMGWVVVDRVDASTGSKAISRQNTLNLSARIHRDAEANAAYHVASDSPLVRSLEDGYFDFLGRFKPPDPAPLVLLDLLTRWFAENKFDIVFEVSVKVGGPNPATLSTTLSTNSTADCFQHFFVLCNCCVAEKVLSRLLKRAGSLEDGAL